MLHHGLATVTEQDRSSGLFRPSRLIDVAPQELSDCRLVITSESPATSHSPYMTLSYCWGAGTEAEGQFRTENWSLQDRLSGFSLSSVSPVVRDAVEVVRSLGVRYLWVDALCIIQGDKTDWERESAQMSSIFHNATATICAGASDSHRQGFLNRTSPYTRVNFRSKIDQTVVGTYNIRWYAVQDVSYLAGSELTHHDYYFCRWGKRGWTFQEQTLSSCVMLFGRGKLHVLTDGYIWSENEDKKEGRYELPCTNSKIRERESRYMSGWLSLMRDYSGRELSVLSDKLPAVAGLARIASEDNPDQYLAGLRRQHMHRDLIWGLDRLPLVGVNLTKESVLASLDSPATYIAPSWSWASRNHAFIDGYQLSRLIFDTPPFKLKHFRSEHTEISAWTSIEGSNPYGEVSDGEILLKAAVVPVPGPQAQSKIMPIIYTASNANGTLATVMLDWSNNGEDEQSDNLELVLVGSCRWKDGYQHKHSFPGNNEHKDSEESPRGQIGVDAATGEHDGSWDGGPASPGEPAAIVWATDEAADEADVSSSNLPTDCDAGRIAYGIVIHPSREPGKYLRVGVFASLPEGNGGLAYFRRQEARTVTII